MPGPLEVDPLSIARVARSWDEQHLDLQAASRQVGTAPLTGFTPAVVGTAARFAAAWQRHTAELAQGCEARADGLRATLDELLTADRDVGLAVDRLRIATGELR